ncbi:hypothetical protein SRABI118_02420 [Massilia sp. Bi118]|uniref:hypothetical protein n=1 Tax=Massilia sp. Bi118 TaxID=2822346 RepID=UPI001D7E5CAD|nr:hypothetical protein [Massilia sp. Bi118]CAH0229108.1 hypothetical protein SRABI118_02420 [Massilia sp. Bi118]
MIDQNDNTLEAERARRKREKNQAFYARSKSQTEHVLLRLGKGSLALLDAARAGTGMSRSAYIDALLRSNACAVRPELPSTRAPSTKSIGDEFEALFGEGA